MYIAMEEDIGDMEDDGRSHHAMGQIWAHQLTMKPSAAREGTTMVRST